MPPLPFAPRPLAGEGLSSWVARLAVHNFVTPGSFKVWLGCGDDDDLAVDSGLIASLAGMTCLETGELRRRFEADVVAAAAPLAVSQPTGIRGAACPVCCRVAAASGGDHFVSPASASLWRISCPTHRVHLTGLEGYRLMLQDQRALFMREEGRIPIGLTGASRPCDLALSFEDALALAVSNRPPGPAWRPRTAASFVASAAILMELVLWRPSGQVPFAYEFEEHRTNGRGVLSVAAVPERRSVLDLLADQGVRNRLNVLTAVATLLARPEACDHPMADQLGWNQRGGPSAFDSLIEPFDRFQRATIFQRLGSWPNCIATPARQALREAR